MLRALMGYIQDKRERVNVQTSNETDYTIMSDKDSLEFNYQPTFCVHSGRITPTLSQKKIA